MGSSPQQENTNPASDAYNFLTPRSPSPRIPQMESKPAQIAAGVYNGAVAPTLDFLASPIGMATAAIPMAGAIPAKIMQTALTPVMAKNAYDTSKNAVQTIQNPNKTTQDVATAGSSALLGMAGLGVGKGKEVPEINLNDVLSHVQKNSEGIVGKKNIFEAQAKSLDAFPEVSQDIQKNLSSKKARDLGGQEHDVHHDPKSHTITKKTQWGKYGSSKSDLPSQYLENIRNLNDISQGMLGSRFVGVMKKEGESPSIVTQHNFIEGEHPESVLAGNQALLDAGFTQALGGGKATEFVEPWITPDGKYEILDVHNGNIIFANDGKGGKIPVIIDGWSTKL